MHLFKIHSLKTRGQSAVELALLIPIFVFLILTFVKLFDTNMTATNRSVEIHIEKLEQFQNGQGMIFDPLTGGFVPEGQYIEAGSSDLLSFEDLAGMLVEELAQMGANALLNALFNKIGFFQESKIIPDFIQAFTISATNSYINSGFTEVDWEGATWDGATAGLSSEQSTEKFQGQFHDSSSARELFGSGLQSAATAFTASHGDETMLAQGFVSGMLSSDTFGEWSEKGEDGAQILKGAARGAITSTTAGLFQGNLDLGTVAKSTALGALQTKAFANTVTGSKFSGDDPRSSMNYSAINAGVSTLISGGSVGDAAFASASGAFYSGQVQSGFGDNRFLQGGADIVFQSGVSFAQGQSLEAVGQGALGSAMGFAMGQATGWVSSQVTGGAENAKSSQEAKQQAKGVTNDDIAGDPALQQNQAYQEGYLEDSLIQMTFIDGMGNFG